MRKNTMILIKIVSFSFALVILSGCLSYSKQVPISSNRFEIRSGGLEYQKKWTEEAKKACPNGYSITERSNCGSSCLQGSIKCE